MRHGPNSDGALNKKMRLWAFLLVLMCVATGWYLHASDLNRQFLLFVHRQSWLPDPFWIFVTQWGDSAQALAFLLAVWLAQPTQLAWVVKTWLMGVIASPLLKAVWDTPRPLSVLDPELLNTIGLTPMGGHSMPSGHAMAAGSLAALLFWGWGHPLRWLVVLLGVLIAFSRVAVGAHWPADVLVGAGLGVLWVLLAQLWEQRQPWAVRLAKPVAQWVLTAVMVLLLWVLWLAPSEGPGSTLARALVSACVLFSALRCWTRRRANPRVDAQAHG